MQAEPDVTRNLGEQFDDLLYRWDEARRRPVVLASVLLGIVLLLAIGWFVTRSGSGATTGPVEDRIPVVSLAPTSPPASEPEVLLVHVAGAVAAPGVYELEAGDRVLDAIERAGGATADGEPDRLNLAAPVADGMQIRVPVEGEAVSIPDSASAESASGPVNLNTATGPQLEALPGVGPATAAAILDYREEIGGFTAVADLLGVRGIGEAKLSALEGLVVV